MKKRKLTVLLLLACTLLPCLAAVNMSFPHRQEPLYTRLYLPGYYPFIYNQIDYYKINKGLNLNKQRPYIVSSFGTTSKKNIDFDNEKIYISTMVGDEKLHPEVTVTFDRYIEGLKLKTFRKSLLSQIVTPQAQTTAQTGGLIKDITIDLPNIAIPKTIRRILGNKAGRLNLDGTQRITLSGSSTKRKIIPIYETNRGARFDFKMQQDTNLRLSGTIGEKIAVNLKYNSNQDETFFDPNNINIKYTGDEDEVVQSIEAGNIALSLSGSRYISYSTSSQGLFGITSKLKFGALDMTVIASKEEGQKNTKSYIGQSQADSTIIYSRNYALRTFYYLDKPENIYNLYSPNDTNIPLGWINNAIKVTAGAWEIKQGAEQLLPKNGTVKVYLDDGDASNNITAIPGVKIYYNPSNPADTTGYIPYYDELIEGTDFVTNYSIGSIELLRAIDRRYTIAVKYVRKNEDLVPFSSNVQDGVLHVKPIRIRNQEYNPANPYSTWDYQMRNIYSMGINNIKNDDFSLEIYTLSEDNTRNYYVPNNLTTASISTYIDYLNLDSTGDGKVNGDDATVNLSSGYVIVPFIKPFYPLGDTLIYQEESESISYNEFKHYISVKGKIGRETISLGQTGILKGSVKVKVNGSTQKENSDYIVDYDMGQITFLTASGKDPDAKIEIDYEYRSEFAIAQKSLAGIRTDWNISDKTKLGSTVIYRSELSAEKRPKIGSENMRLFLADIDGSTTWKPGFITRWIDALPLISTKAESEMSLSGEVALTIPDIYGDDKHKNEGFIDDMEGILDSYPLGLSFSTWVLGSKPWQTSLPKSRINWYNPQNIRMKDVYEESTLSESEKNENITVLAMKLFPNSINQPGLSNLSYGGVMKYIGNQLDFSSKKYIELLVKVDNYDNIPPNITLHIDLGDINEDFYTDYGGLNVLNTEDKNRDGVLSPGEDTGLDGIPDGQPGDDPNDNAVHEDADASGDYPRKNGTENNNILDTEDLDNNGILNQLDRYFSFSVSVTNHNPSQNQYLVDYFPNKKYLLLRIPLNQIPLSAIVNSSFTGVQPSLKKISYVRLWAETDRTARLLIASASVVGNKWEDFHIRYLNNTIVPTPVLNSNNESYISGIIDNQKSSHYTPPKNSFYKEQGKPLLEQALTLKVENLQNDHKVFLRQRLIDYYNLLSYGRILFWVYPENSETDIYNDSDSLDIVFRMGADSLHYYQVRQRLKVLDYNASNNKMREDWWTSLDYRLQDFSSIKDTLQSDIELEKDGKFYLYRGNPTLTNIREFTLGVQNSSEASYSGITYFNDIRVADPYEEIGWAGRLTFNSVFADLSTLNIDYEQKSENFNPNIQRGRTQSFTFSSLRSLKIMNKYFLDKFLPDTWGIRIPLSLDRNYTISIPRFRSNSDVLRNEIIDSNDKDREKTENLNYSATAGISQAIQPNNKLLAYTLSKMTLNGKVTQTYSTSATARDTTFTWQGTYSYNINIPENALSKAIIKTYRVRFLPSTITNNFTMNSSQPKSYNWEKRELVSGWYPRVQTFPSKNLTTDNGLTWGLTSDVITNYRLTTKRDLIQKHYFKDFNIGKETEYNQDIGANYAPAYFPNIFNLTNSIASRYTENQRKYTSYATTTQQDTYQKDGSSARTLRVNFSLLNSTLLSSFSNRIKTKSSPSNPKQDFKNPKPKQSTKDDGFESDESYQSIDKNEPHPDTVKDIRDFDEAYFKEEALRKSEESELPKQENSELDTSASDNEVVPKLGKKEGINLSPVIVIDLLSKIKNLTATYQNNYTQTFTRQTKRPGFAFQVGLPNQVPPDFLDSKSTEDTYTFGSGVAVSRKIDTTINYSFAMTQRFSTASNQTVAQTFPDVALTVSDIDRFINLPNVISNTRLNSGYQFVLRQNGDIDWIKPKQETKTWSLNPLASISTKIFNGVQTTLSYNRSKSDNITDMTTYQILRTTNSQSLSSNLSYSFSSSKGIEIPFTKRKINIRNELTSSVGITYEKNYDTTKGREATQLDRSSSRIVISPTATYQFDQNIKGGFTSGYELTTDKKRDDATRIIRFGLWVEITL